MPRVGEYVQEGDSAGAFEALPDGGRANRVASVRPNSPDVRSIITMTPCWDARAPETRSPGFRKGLVPLEFGHHAALC